MPPLISALFPSAPTFTDKDLPSLIGQVFIVTGAASGVGFELAKILFAAGGTVYIAARSSSRCADAIEKIKAQAKGNKPAGKLESMIIDLADLGTVKSAVDEFLRRETRLDVLFQNAGVMVPPAGSKGKQGHDLEIATNCLGPYLLTILLEPILLHTAASRPPLSVRVVFVVSLIQLGTPKGGMSFDEQGTPEILPNATANYMQSKAGGTWLAAEFAKRLGSKNILSVCVHPGLMKTKLQRNMPAPAAVVMKTLFKGPVYGAYSELFAGFSYELKAENNGAYIMAWGRVAKLPEHVSNGFKSEAEGGTGAGKKFLEYCERETKDFR